MSGRIDAVIASFAAGMGDATYGAVENAAYSAYTAVRRLHQDYTNALTAFRERSASEEQQRAAQLQHIASLALAATTLAAQTQVSAGADATLVFLTARVERLAERVAKLPAQEDELATQVAALQQAIAETPQDVAAHFEQYRRLADALARITNRHLRTPAAKNLVAAELAALREEIESSLLAGEDYTEVRTQMLAQLEALEGLAARQPSLVSQGLALLRERVHRELVQRAQRLQERDREAEEMRTLVGEMLAKLQAVAAQEDLPEFNEQAQVLLANLGQELTHPSADNLAALRRLSDDAGAVFQGCEKALAEQEIAAEVSTQVQEVLQSLGYEVTEIPPADPALGRSLVAKVDGEVGVHFQVSGNGRLETEAVAFSRDAAVADGHTSAKVCTLVDRVFAALKERQWRVRERYRSPLLAGETMRVVEMEEQEEDDLQVAAEPKQMRAE